MSLKQLSALFVILHRQKVVIWMMALLLILAIANEVAIYNIGLITGSYYRILNDKDEAAFFQQTIKSLLLIVAISLLKSFKEFVSSMIYVKWRSTLTTDLQEHYFRNMSFYKLNVLNVVNQQTNSSLAANGEAVDKVADNVDQRITVINQLIQSVFS